MMIRRSPFGPLPGFNPLEEFDLPHGGITDPQSSYLKTPLIRPTTNMQERVEKELKKDTDKESKD
ncbi:hypothetical protein C8J36_102620 [Rhizobium sp. PP-F2F-G48]|uniref:hypothetical protein n=1 Tax=Rhizobium sp. PP-F2F-G48 TaxID=2135651 RepID=UPI00104C92A5|nr:hypothetical protein [Rhizobium sp. PP-F2F-G48]TCM57817.1 hypothetical protein C8J36_102620 [Rhizobium sp. PP-F2F-G48]